MPSFQSLAKLVICWSGSTALIQSSISFLGGTTCFFLSPSPTHPCTTSTPSILLPPTDCPLNLPECNAIIPISGKVGDMLIWQHSINPQQHKLLRRDNLFLLFPIPPNPSPSYATTADYLLDQPGGGGTYLSAMPSFQSLAKLVICWSGSTALIHSSISFFGGTTCFFLSPSPT